MGHLEGSGPPPVDQNEPRLVHGLVPGGLTSRPEGWWVVGGQQYYSNKPRGTRGRGAEEAGGAVRVVGQGHRHFDCKIYHDGGTQSAM